MAELDKLILDMRKARLAARKEKEAEQDKVRANYNALLFAKYLSLPLAKIFQDDLRFTNTLEREAYACQPFVHHYNLLRHYPGLFCLNCKNTHLAETEKFCVLSCYLCKNEGIFKVYSSEQTDKELWSRLYWTRELIQLKLDRSTNEYVNQVVKELKLCLANSQSK